MVLKKALKVFVVSFATFVFSSAVYLQKTANTQPISPQPRQRTVISWDFNRDGDFEGWTPNREIVDAKVEGGVLSFKAVGLDPILEYRLPLDIPASPWHAIEIHLKADRDGIAEFFWSNTTEPPYGGFRPNKRTKFWVIGDGQWRTYRILPFWHPEGKIIRLRFDPYGDANFQVDYIRIVELSTGQVRDWFAVGEIELRRQRDGLTAVMREPDALLLMPVSVDAETNAFVSIRMAVNAGSVATLFFATEQTHGLHSRSFPIIADGKVHTYTLDMLGLPQWRGRVIAVGLRPTNASGVKAQIFSVQISDRPQGEPELQVKVFALDDATPRANVPTEIFAIVTNRGGQPLRNIKATLRLPAGVETISQPKPIDSLEFGEEAELRWRIVARKPLKGVATLTVTADKVSPVTTQLTLNFPQRLSVAKSDYVPEPRPVRGKYEVGVYYFPGWKSWGQWLPIFAFPERKPVLGWYREGDPEVADWHIKWAVEHGITFFAYDWYWVQGARQLEHALHDGYMRARYRHLLKFCLLWANHNPPKTSSLEDCIAVTRFWIANYFRLPEYFTVDGKPVVIIFSTHRLTEDLGSEGVRKAFDAMRQECVNHGLKGLYLVACVWDAGQAQRAAAEGYDAVTTYTWATLGIKPEEKWSPFDLLIDAYRRNWEDIARNSPIPIMVPICGGWDSRPWHGDKAVVRFGRNPENFKRHLQDAKAFLDKYVPQGKALPIAIIEAWNEWGEGSYIEPHAEFGFGYLDAVREVFTDAPKKHLDLAPVDVGLPLKEVERWPSDKDVWDFEQNAEGWDYYWMQIVDVKVEKGCLVGRTTGGDPAFFGPLVQLQANKYRFVVIRMRLTKMDDQTQAKQDVGQLFWRTMTLPESEATSFRFTVQVDGHWHEYRLPVHENKYWRGVIRRLRLD
ncbi:MAG: glycoside hydrolase family 99-like domain-containing protein, partial [Armatimonadota bacterium]